MNKVIYFTNAVEQNYFKEYLPKWVVSPNLSNQNFHAKMVKALSLYFKVDVISIRPINHHFQLKKLPSMIFDQTSIKWHYPKVSSNKISKLLFLNHSINKIYKNTSEDSVIFVDTMNLSLLKAAIKFAKKYHSKIYGICTDNPNNISLTSNYYKTKIIKLGKTLDGYVVLTDSINKLYNKGNKPFVLIDGISENVNVPKTNLVNDKYIYFGGSLMREYGVYNLIEAFKQLNLDDTKLILCGHHLQNDLLKAIGNTINIKYLGPISYEENLSLEKNAIVSVNPRPINPIIDDYSIPSKTLECLAIGSLNITVRNKLLEKNYKDCIIWSETENVEDLKKALLKAISLTNEEKEKLIKLGKEKVMERTSLEHVGQLLKKLII